MKKILVLFFSLLLCACQTQSNPDAFYKAFQALLEQPYTHFEGEVSAATFSFDVKGTLASDPFELALDLRDDPPLDFYLVDGKTYLNDDGTKTSSLASALGINIKKATDLNPFTALSAKQREELFTSVTQTGNTYNMDINTGLFSHLLDQYGAFTIKSATLKAVIEDGIITQMQLNTSGTINYGLTLPFDAKASFTFTRADGIDIPSDLSSYTQESYSLF